MPYIGTDINYGNLAKQTGTGDGADTTPIAPLTYTVPSSESILVFLDGVCQVPTTDFVVSGGTTLTFTTAPANGVAILVMFLGRSLDIGTPADNTVTNAKMANNAIDSAELVAGSVDLAHMSSQSVDEDNLHISNAGSNGDFLSKQSGDAGGLTWAAAGGGLNFIEKRTGSDDATIDFLTSFSSTYDVYLFTWYSTQPITDGQSLCFRVAQGGAAQTGGSYHRALKAHSEANGAGNNGATSNSFIYLSGTGTGNATVDEHCNGNIWVYNPLSSAVTGMHWQTWVNNQSNIMWYETGAGGYFANNTALTGCQFLYESGNVSNGEFVLYGLAKS